MAEAYHCRPSELLGISNKLHAYFLDRAVFYFGAAIDSDLEASTRTAKTDMQRQQKRNMVLNRWKVNAEGAKGRFRDPASR
jgi:hypothetical protein